jgi:hypothetical protein
MNGNRIKKALAVGLALVAGGLFAQTTTVSYLTFRRRANRSARSRP